MTPKAVSIVAGGTATISGGVVNLPAKARLTIKKYVVDRLEGGSAYAASDGLSGFTGDYGKFKFTLSWPDSNGDGEPESSVHTMNSTGTLVIDNLPRLDSNGNLIQYTLKENALTGSDALLYETDGAQPSWTFEGSGESFDFFNRLKGELQINKQKRNFDAGGVQQTSAMAGASFKLYRKNGDDSYTRWPMDSPTQTAWCPSRGSPSGTRAETSSPTMWWRTRSRVMCRFITNPALARMPCPARAARRPGL
jgi:hypothetical protein